MSCKKCSNCFFGDKCRSATVCDNYDPITECAEDERIADVLEEGYIEYCDAWETYIKRFRD